MANATVKWVTPPSVIHVNLTALEAGFRGKVNRLMRGTAVRWQSLAQATRPWTDQSGAARAELKGEATVTDMGGEITLSHGVHYGIYLELANRRRYAVIKPTQLVVESELENKLQGLLG